MATLVAEETDEVEIVKVTDVAPAATVTLPGTVAAALLLETDTTAPPEGAAAVRVTVPWEEAPPVRLAGLTETVDSAAGCGLTTSVAPVDTPLYEAVMETLVAEETDAVETVKVAVVAPAATVTLPGTVAAALLLDSDTIAPPDGAAAVKVTVPWDEAPPIRLAGLTVTDDSAADCGLTVSIAFFETPLYEPVIETLVAEETELVETVKVAVAAPAATVTLAGTVAAALLLDSDTTAPPEGAAVVKVTVH